jgi:hypothetical protein
MPNQSFLLEEKKEYLISMSIKTTLEQISDLKINVTELKAFITNIIDHYPEFLKNNSNL